MAIMNVHNEQPLVWTCDSTSHLSNHGALTHILSLLHNVVLGCAAPTLTGPAYLPWKQTRIMI